MMGQVMMMMVARQVVGCQVWMMELGLTRDVAKKNFMINYDQLATKFLLVVINSLLGFNTLPKKWKRFSL